VDLVSYPIEGAGAYRNFFKQRGTRNGNIGPHPRQGRIGDDPAPRPHAASLLSSATTMGYLYRKFWGGLWSLDVTKSGGISLEVWSVKTTVDPPHREHGTVSRGSWPPKMNRSSITKHLLHLYWYRFIHFLPDESMAAGT
jgi:hypothetical protein